MEYDDFEKHYAGIYRELFFFHFNLMADPAGAAQKAKAGLELYKDSLYETLRPYYKEAQMRVNDLKDSMSRYYNSNMPAFYLKSILEENFTIFHEVEKGLYRQIDSVREDENSKDITKRTLFVKYRRFDEEVISNIRFSDLVISPPSISTDPIS